MSHAALRDLVLLGEGPPEPVDGTLAVKGVGERRGIACRCEVEARKEAEARERVKKNGTKVVQNREFTRFLKRCGPF